MELNRDQIIKALECCLIQGAECRKCPMVHTHALCYREIKRNALALIKELTEENERLKAENELVQVSHDSLRELYRTDTDALLNVLSNFREETADIITDTVRKMQKRLHEKTFIDTLGETGNYKMIRKSVMLVDIDQIAKEMLEE